jgi:hypothetical protein
MTFHFKVFSLMFIANAVMLLCLVVITKQGPTGSQLLRIALWVFWLLVSFNLIAQILEG